MESSVLSLVIFLPFLLSFPLFSFNRAQHGTARWYALLSSLLVFAGALYLALQFNPSSGFQFEHTALQNWLGDSMDVKYSVALDGTSMLLFAFAAFMFPVVVLGSWERVTTNAREYYFFLLMLETCILGIFSAVDLFLYYMFWEAMLIPMYFLIGVWGGNGRGDAATKFFIYMLSASLVMLIGILSLGYISREMGGTFTTDYRKLLQLELPLSVQNILFWLFGLSFFVKAPLFPLHAWAADVYSESPTGAVLTGVLLKMATYALIRFNVMLFPTASANFAPLVCTLAVVAIIYGALVAMSQPNAKRLLAFSSVSHLGFIVLGIFSFTQEALQGAMILMVNSGLTTGLLLMLVGWLEERRGDVRLSEFGGLKKNMPMFSAAFLIATFASIGLPGLSGFIGEFLTLSGAFKSTMLQTGLYAMLAALGVILSAAYMLPMVQKIFTGELTSERNAALSDLTPREILVAALLVAMIIWIGVAPNSFLKLSETSSQAVIEFVTQKSASQALAK